MILQTIVIIIFYFLTLSRWSIVNFFCIEERHFIRLSASSCYSRSHFTSNQRCLGLPHGRRLDFRLVCCSIVSDTTVPLKLSLYAWRLHRTQLLIVVRCMLDMRLSQTTTRIQVVFILARTFALPCRRDPSYYMHSVFLMLRWRPYWLKQSFHTLIWCCNSNLLVLARKLSLVGRRVRFEGRERSYLPTTRVNRVPMLDEHRDSLEICSMG